MTNKGSTAKTNANANANANAEILRFAQDDKSRFGMTSQDLVFGRNSVRHGVDDVVDA